MIILNTNHFEKMSYGTFRMHQFNSHLRQMDYTAMISVNEETEYSMRIEKTGKELRYITD